MDPDEVDWAEQQKQQEAATAKVDSVLLLNDQGLCLVSTDPAIFAGYEGEITVADLSCFDGFGVPGQDLEFIGQRTDQAGNFTLMIENVSNRFSHAFA